MPGYATAREGLLEKSRISGQTVRDRCILTMEHY
jgi:hypothetical protein